MKRFPSVFLGLAIALSGTLSQAQTALPVLSDKGISEIDSVLQKAVQQGTVPGVGGTRAEISGSALARANYGSLHGTASIEWLSGIPLSFGGESIADAEFLDMLTITGYVGSGFVNAVRKRIRS